MDSARIDYAVWIPLLQPFRYLIKLDIFLWAGDIHKARIAGEADRGFAGRDKSSPDMQRLG